jgi:hypothetical protein
MEFIVELWNLAEKNSEFGTVHPSIEIANWIAQRLADKHSEGWTLTHIVPVSHDATHGNTQAYYHFHRPN